MSVVEQFIKDHPEEMGPDGKLKVCIGGGAGFIGSHIAMKLREKGCYVVCADWKDNEFMKPEQFCDEFHKVDLRLLENCLKVTAGCQHVYNLAADMGGMGFIVSNQAVLLYNNTMISFNMLEAARQQGAKRYFYSSTACVYNEALQTDPSNPGLREDMAWPARPQDTYGLEKLYAEEMCISYAKDFPIKTRMARYHNVYGPNGTWKGGREKVPAAFCRKAVVSTTEFEVWGDGKQTRSFMLIDDCVEGSIRIMLSECAEPLNLGTDEMIDMNDFAKLAMSFEGKNLPIKNIPGPEPSIENQNCNILSFSGGGSFGVVEVGILSQIVLDKYDMITGVSAGGLNAGFLSYYNNMDTNLNDGIDNLANIYIQMNNSDVYTHNFNQIQRTWSPKKIN